MAKWELRCDAKMGQVIAKWEDVVAKQRDEVVKRVHGTPTVMAQLGTAK